MKKIASLLVLAALIISLSACGAGTATEPAAESVPFEVKTQTTPEPTATPEAEEPVAMPEETPIPGPETGPIDPLTGEPTAEDIGMLRPYAVMINNISVAQPQVGISQADMICELMDEGGITRMMAFFTDIASVERVGSIRSARLYNVSMAEAFDAILVHAGGSDEALNYISAVGITDIDSVTGRYTGDTFYRDPTRQARGIEHSLFAYGSAIAQSAVDLGYAAAHPDGYDGSYGLRFSQTAEEQCVMPAAVVEIRYAGGKTTGFTYDEGTGLYTCSQFGDVYADNGETPVTFKNVLILDADTTLQSDGLHLTIELIGEGDGYFCCGGRYVPIRWSRSGANDSFHYALEDGSPLTLGVGRTFVAVQQVGGYSGENSFREG